MHLLPGKGVAPVRRRGMLLGGFFLAIYSRPLIQPMQTGTTYEQMWEKRLLPSLLSTSPQHPVRFLGYSARRLENSRREDREVKYRGVVEGDWDWVENAIAPSDSERTAPVETTLLPHSSYL
ncbi:hypothetical protein B0H14DRAFT_2612698 [Mycena olivaceomarginata]|nr:hypothetical protein B0H14DRAFT_2612698 [Mycena olivaceomarginata]